LSVALHQIVQMEEMARALGQERAAIVNLALDERMRAQRAIDDLSQARAVSDLHAAALHAEQQTSKELRAALGAASSKLTDAQTRLRNALSREQSQAQRAEHAAERHAALLRRHQETQDQLMHEIRQLQSHRDELASALLGLHGSRSLRLGRALSSPLRYLKGLFRAGRTS
jgi:chromosome segregation ATPase